jgi:hypothetical protein
LIGIAWDGGGSKLMSMAEEVFPLRKLLALSRPFIPFNLPFQRRSNPLDGGEVEKPSSVSQSLRSIRDVFLPSTGGDAEEDLEDDREALKGEMDAKEDAVGEMGASSRFKLDGGGDVGGDVGVAWGGE